MRKIINFFKKLFMGRRAEKLDLVYPTSWETMSLQDFKDACEVLSHPNGRAEMLFLLWCRLAHIVPANPNRYDPKAIKDMFPFTFKGKDYVVGYNLVHAGAKDMEYILDSIGLPPSPIEGVDRKLYGVPFNGYYQAASFMMRYSADNNNEKWLKEAVKSLTGGRVRRLLPWQKKGVVIWWNGVQDFLLKKYPDVLTSEESITSKTQADLLLDLLSTMNDNKPQDNDNILKSDTHAVLYSLNKIYAKSKRSH